jgi:DNA processing protein
VSGLAYGIDIMAHKACLKYNIPTIGIMANGIDKVYPSIHKSTSNEMLKNGGLITENSFGTLPDGPKFPERNRIIAGMADAVIVIEAKAKGGALTTAEIANSYDREVFAVPGKLFSSTSEGCNNLIKQHKANLITKVDDLKYIMNWSTDPKAEVQQTIPFQELSKEEQIIIKLLKKGEIHIDELSIQSDLPIQTISSLLLKLEMDNLVKTLPGKKFSLR